MTGTNILRSIAGGFIVFLAALGWLGVMVFWIDCEFFGGKLTERLVGG